MRDVQAGEKRLVSGEYRPIMRTVAEPCIDVMTCSSRNAFSNSQ